MEKYKHLSGESGVVAFKIEPGAITVQFEDNAVYRYTDQSAGSRKIQTMQRFAREGRGLNSFINREAKKEYASKS